VIAWGFSSGNEAKLFCVAFVRFCQKAFPSLKHMITDEGVSLTAFHEEVANCHDQVSDSIQRSKTIDDLNSNLATKKDELVSLFQTTSRSPHEQQEKEQALQTTSTNIARLTEQLSAASNLPESFHTFTTSFCCLHFAAKCGLENTLFIYFRFSNYA
jgi:hypothetical protein